MRFRFTAPLWEWSARAEWYFVTVPEEASADIREIPRPPRGFGAVKVRVRVGVVDVHLPGLDGGRVRAPGQAIGSCRRKAPRGGACRRRARGRRRL